MCYLHAEKGKDEDEEEEEEEQGEDGGNGVRQSQHQVSQARPVPDIMRRANLSYLVPNVKTSQCWYFLPTL